MWEKIKEKIKAWCEWAKAHLQCYCGSFVTRQQARLKVAQLAHYSAGEIYLREVKRKCNRERRLKLLYKLHRDGAKYFGLVDSEVLRRGQLSDSMDEQWREEWTTSASRVLAGILRYQETLRKERKKLGLPESTFEASDGSYRSIQAFYAAVFPEKVAEQKQAFLNAKLPVLGFDKPYIVPRVLQKPMSPRLASLLTLIVLIAVLIVSTHYVAWWLLPGVLGVALLAFILIEVFDLRRRGQLKEKGLVEILKIVLTRNLPRFVFRWKPDSGDSDKKTK